MTPFGYESHVELGGTELGEGGAGSGEHPFSRSGGHELAASTFELTRAEAMLKDLQSLAQGRRRQAGVPADTAREMAAGKEAVATSRGTGRWTPAGPTLNSPR
ncbi:MAG: hypothetical protein WKF83_14335 [Nocardioidaceae bacterium]